MSIWNTITGAHILDYDDTDEDRVIYTPVSVAWQPNGKYIACGSADGIYRVWDVDTRKTALTHEYGSGALAWSLDGGRIASCQVYYVEKDQRHISLIAIFP